MPFILLAVTIFLLFLQPVAIYPELAFLNPIRNMTLLSLGGYFLMGGKNEVIFTQSKTNLYCMLFVAMQIISPMASWVGSITESLVTWLLYIFLYFLIIKQCNSVQRVRTLVLMIVLAVCYLSYYSLTHFVAYYEPGQRAGGFGWYENPNDLSLILVCTIPLVLLLAESSGTVITQVFWYFISGMFIFNVLFTGSRSGMIGICLVTGLGLFFSTKLTGMLKKVVTVVMIIAVFGTGVAVITSRGDLKGLHGDDSSENRVIQWEAGIRMTVANPFLGVGPGEFENYADRFGGIHGLAPHNTLVQAFAETGVLGGVFFVMFACQPLYRYVRNIKDKVVVGNTEIQLYHNFFFSSLCGFWSCAFFSNRYKTYILFVLVAILVAVRDYLADASLDAKLPENR
jgi:O-antigen ligase